MSFVRRRFKRFDPTAYLLVAPAVVLVVFMYLLPMVRVVVDSLHSPTKDGTSQLGLANYGSVLEDPAFWQSAGNNVFFLLGVPMMTGIALLFAAILFDRIRGWRVYRTLIFTPYILAVAVIGTTFVYIYSFNGILNTVLRGAGVGGLAQDWLGDPALVTPSILSVIVYREVGFGVMLFLARMAAIRPELFEAAMIDGAGWWARIRYVTVPQLRGVIAFFVIIELITMLCWVFGYVYSMTGGGPGFASSVLELYIWKNAFAYRAVGIASAVAVILLLAATTMILLQVLLRGQEDGLGDEAA